MWSLTWLQSNTTRWQQRRIEIPTHCPLIVLKNWIPAPCAHICGPGRGSKLMMEGGRLLQTDGYHMDGIIEWDGLMSDWWITLSFCHQKHLSVELLISQQLLWIQVLTENVNQMVILWHHNCHNLKWQLRNLALLLYVPRNGCEVDYYITWSFFLTSSNQI